ncbi:MAG: hypothetical protein FRX49_05338 [Trebouxia sp. A1-2]|nr:MAG: hypothetical protein FRX49_05338 [Trebouxia sp. A1-2]
MLELLPAEYNLMSARAPAAVVVPAGSYAEGNALHNIICAPQALGREGRVHVHDTQSGCTKSEGQNMCTTVQIEI